MTEHSVCAIVVTYHPHPDMVGNMAIILSQTEAMVVVDNGSTDSELEILRDASRVLGFELIENGQNLGIAAGLNLGVHWAKSRGFPFVALFDQDSTVTDGFIGKMVSMYENHPRRTRVGLIGAGYRHKVTGECPPPRLLAKDGGPVEIMTSGSFLPTGIFDDCGYFQEDLFIDSVDYEYCFRLREAGFIALHCPEALLLHAAGSPVQVELFGRTIITFSNHSAGRWYYITRNSCFLLSRYGRQFPRWAMATIVLLFIKAPIKVLLVKEERWKKIRNMVLGAIDAGRGRMGYRVKL
jgi:rhamnosyltransferase